MYSSNSTQVIADFFNRPCYRVNVLTLRICGLWPYQSKFEGKLLRFLWAFFVSSQMIPQICVCITDFGMDTLTSTIPPFTVAIIAGAKMIISTLKVNQIIELLVTIQKDWSKLKSETECEIMKKHLDQGKKLTLFISIWYYNSMVVFLLLPMRPKVMTWLGLSQGPADFDFPYPVNYGVDHDKYFYAIETHISFCSTLVITTIIAADTLFIVLVQHICGIFKIISYRLENLVSSSNLDIDLHPSKINDRAFWVISDCIKKHNKAIQFAELLENSYCWIFFISVGLETLLMTFSGVQLVSQMSNIDGLFRYGPFAFGQLVHVFIENAISQQLINYSGGINDAISMIKWYTLSMRSRKLLTFMIMRSQVICSVSAGKMIIMSMETFGMILKTTMSYFTILSSMQED
ncbi:odorant receptor 13a-like [Microplitis demolitor]|uniref:odorant receptor 13a-like n=1 Tax=Microplitis demolitor TaxID=69319 RepID=UPI0004CDACB4|nr:odorant receptor 13a-like [Microplitis demolitor]